MVLYFFVVVQYWVCYFGRNFIGSLPIIPIILGCVLNGHFNKCQNILAYYCGSGCVDMGCHKNKICGLKFTPSTGHLKFTPIPKSQNVLHSYSGSSTKTQNGNISLIRPQNKKIRTLSRFLIIKESVSATSAARINPVPNSIPVLHIC